MMAFDATVQAAQRRLNELIATGRLPGVTRLAEDGIFGPLTSRALGVFQGQQNLQVTGRLDNATRLRLFGVAVTGSLTATPSPNYAAAVGAAALSRVLGVPPSALIHIRDAANRAFAITADSLVTLRDAAGNVFKVTGHGAAAGIAAGRAVVEAVELNGLDITAVARAAAGAWASEFFSSPVFLMGILAITAIILFSD